MTANRIGSLIPISLLVLACGDPTAQTDGRWFSLNGSYAGTYAITHGYSTPSPRTEVGQARLEIEAGRYTLVGDVRYVPPSGCGTVRVGETVQFADDCFHTAEFDWTLIVSGDFVYTRVGHRITLERHDRRLDRLQRIELERAG
jgi:hypothetical protein